MAVAPPRLAAPADPRQEIRPGGCATLQLTLLDGFELGDHQTVVELTSGAQRLLAFLAFHERPVRRAFVAGTLWIDATDDRAAANLRSTLWRLPPPARSAVIVRGNLISLSPDVGVDLRAADRAARHLIENEGDPLPPDGRGAEADGLLLTMELLPDWYDDWVLIERERLRHLRLHALESLCRHLTAVGRFGQAVDAGLAAVVAEPFRESAHRSLIAAHLAEGNYVEALRQYEAFRGLMEREHHLPPSPEMDVLVQELLIRSRGVDRTRA